MLIFDSSYNRLVTQYIVPLSDYGIPYSKLKQNHIKSLLVGKTKNVIQQAPSNFSFSFNKDDLLTALIGDCNLFYAKSLLQMKNVSTLNENNSLMSADWIVVTDYYYSFYIANLLLRLCYRGTIFADKLYQKKLNEVIDVFCPGQSIVGNNLEYRVEIDDKNGEYTIFLSSTAKNTHELVWDNVAELIKEISQYAKPNSEEYTILKSLVQVNNRQGSAFPSKLRNQVNYQPYYGVKTINKEYYPPQFALSSWLTPILDYDGKKLDDDQSIIRLFASYSEFLQQLTFNLINKYEEIRGRESGILSAVNKNREEKISVPDEKCTYP